MANLRIDGADDEEVSLSQDDLLRAAILIHSQDMPLATQRARFRRKQRRIFEKVAPGEEVPLCIQSIGQAVDTLKQQTLRAIMTNFTQEDAAMILDVFMDEMNLLLDRSQSNRGE